MKSGLKKSFALFVGSLILVGCNEQPNREILNVGFNKYNGSSSPTPQVGLAFTAENKQPLDATFDVYIGARNGFSENWKNNFWNCNPGYGKFAVNRVIENEVGEELKNEYIILDDFPDDEKYPLTYETIEGTTDGVIMHYTGYIVDTFDFGSINEAKGSIGYYICYYDDANSKSFEENVYLYGISWGGKINFDKNDEGVILSK